MWKLKEAKGPCILIGSPGGNTTICFVAVWLWTQIHKMINTLNLFYKIAKCRMISLVRSLSYSHAGMKYIFYFPLNGRGKRAASASGKPSPWLASLFTAKHNVPLVNCRAVCGAVCAPQSAAPVGRRLAAASWPRFSLALGSRWGRCCYNQHLESLSWLQWALARKKKRLCEWSQNPSK